jgi:hypothetical protein
LGDCPAAVCDSGFGRADSKKVQVEAARRRFIIYADRTVTGVVVNFSKELGVLDADGVGKAVAVYMVEVRDLEGFEVKVSNLDPIRTYSVYIIKMIHQPRRRRCKENMPQRLK